MQCLFHNSNASGLVIKREDDSRSLDDSVRQETDCSEKTGRMGPSSMPDHDSDRKRKITLKSAIGYGVGDFFGGGQMALIGTYLALFWTRFCGMSIGTAQAFIGMSALISAVAALCFGILDDNLYRFRLGRRFGRRRLIIFMVSPMILLGILMWIPGFPTPVYFVTYAFWIIVAQLFAAAYNPLAGEMTRDFGERNKLSTTRLTISGLSGTVILIAGGFILGIFGDRHPKGYMILAISIVVLFSVAVFICWHSTWEMTPQEAGFGQYAREEGKFAAPGDANSKTRSKDESRHGTFIHRIAMALAEYASTLRLSIFRKHLCIYLLIQISNDVFGQVFVFFVIYDWNRTAAFASLLLSSGVISLPLMPLFSTMLTRFGPKPLYAVGFVGALASLLLMFVSTIVVGRLPDPWWTVFVYAGSILYFTFRSLYGSVPWAMFPFISDVDQVVTGRYRPSTFSGIQAGLRQMFSGLANILVGMVLMWCGFDSTRHWQPQSAKLGLAVLMFGWVAVSVIVALLVSRAFTLDRRTDAVVLDEINRKREGGRPCDIAPGDRAVIESLTGLPYGRGMDRERAAGSLEG